MTDGYRTVWIILSAIPYPHCPRLGLAGGSPPFIWPGSPSQLYAPHVFPRRGYLGSLSLPYTVVSWFFHNGDPQLLKLSSNQRSAITSPCLCYAWIKAMTTERSASGLCVQTFLALVDQSFAVVRFLRAGSWRCCVDLRTWVCRSLLGLERTSMFIPLPAGLCQDSRGSVGWWQALEFLSFLESTSRSCRTWLAGKWAGSGTELRELQLDMPACGAHICATALGGVGSTIMGKTKVWTSCYV